MRKKTHKRSPARDERLQRMRRNAWSNRDLGGVIRAHCAECVGGELPEIDKCTAPRCSLYPWRMGEGRSKGFDLAADLLDGEGCSDLAQKCRRSASTDGADDQERTFDTAEG